MYKLFKFGCYLLLNYTFITIFDGVSKSMLIKI